MPGHAELVFCDQSIERTLGWLSKCRAILVRYDKKAANYLGLIKIACIAATYRSSGSRASPRVTEQA